MKREERECIRAWEEFKTTRNFAEELPETVWLGGDITLPNPPPYKEIANYGLPKEKRKFPYIERSFIDSLVPDTPEYESFIEQEDERRFNGFWFFNGDKLEYITGKHYMTLQYWLIPILSKKLGRRKKGNPLFRDKHRDWFLACDHIRYKMKQFGLIYYGSRRDGKTANAISYGFWDTTENFDSHFAIQSKSHEDAKKVFKKIIYSWKTLPEMFKPIDKGYTAAAYRLDFSEDTKKQGQKKTYKEVLNSSIEAYQSLAAAIDGIDSTIVFHDETGKSPKVDVLERWNIAKQTMSTSGGNPIGFGIVTTTVEEMDKGGGEIALKLWRESKQDSFPTGLVPLFFPAYYGMEGDDESGDDFIDEWGYSNCELALQTRMNKRSKLKGNSLLSEMRKFPIKEEDMFINPDIDVPYPVVKIQQQIEHNNIIETLSPLWIKGNFIMTGALHNRRSHWMPDENGKFMMHKLPPEEMRNKFEYRNGCYRPIGNNFSIGIDPFDHDGTVGRRHSKGSALVIARPGVFPGYNKPMPIIYYCYRPETALIFFDDMLALMMFCSSSALIENQKYGLVLDLKRLGYDEFADWNPLEIESEQPNRGIPTTGKDTRTNLVNTLTLALSNYVGLDSQNEMGYFAFTDLLKEYLAFESEKWTSYDGTVASMLAYLNLNKPVETFMYNPIESIYQSHVKSRNKGKYFFGY